MMRESWWLRVAVWLRVRRWSDWLLLVAAHLLHGLLLRALVTPALLSKWATASQQHVLWVPVLGIVLGAAEDALVCVFALTLYRMLDAVCGPAKRVRATTAAAASSLPRALQNSHGDMSASGANIADSLRFAGYALVFALSNAFFTADAVLVRTRQLRASIYLVLLYVRERDAADELQVDAQELRILHEHVALTAAFALAVGFFGAVWSDLTEWDVLRALQHFRVRYLGWRRPPAPAQQYLPVSQQIDDDDNNNNNSKRSHRDEDNNIDTLASQRWVDRVSARTLLVLALAASAGATLELSKLVPSIVAMVALNASLNEPLRLLFGFELYAIRHVAVRPGRRMADFVEHETEDAEMVSDDALVRRTRGFTGPLAFNVSIAPDEQLNVLVVVVESFRQRDSRYLLQEDAFAQLFPPEMPSLTPQFDKWAARGVGFRNMWSSWRTSRALEAILFGQVPYDSVASTGTTGGRPDVALAGLPQLFKAKGYECLFTTGSRANYEDWDTFLPAHGFDHVLDADTVIDIATDELGIDVTEGEQVMTYWGVHDHVSFDVLGYLLQKQHAEQQNRSIHNNVDAERGPSQPRWSNRLDTTKPWFVTHFTISSHVPFDERPDWYHRYSHEIPDFSAFYRRNPDSDSDSVRDERETLLRNYAEMRYFTDLTFGHFMDNLNKSGVLNNTLVLVTGDHGQAPERGSATPEQDPIAATRVAGALIAEGRLGDSAGLLFDDVASHADFLNTLADIVGVPRNDNDDTVGFLQSGVGHSLKRAVPFGQRVVHSSNPAMSMAAVQGHTRMEYYTEFSDVVRAFDAERDPSQTHDLMGDFTADRVQQVLEICADGRLVSEYFKRRWDNACILAPTC